MRKCAIHQPNFFPWLPFFSKIKQSDIFVFLDNVDYPKSGNSMGSWVNRVKIDMHGKDTWYFCPVIRESGPQIIKDVQINWSSKWTEDRLKTFRHAYGRYKNCDAVMELLGNLLSNANNFSKLSDFNQFCIKKICETLNIGTPMVKQSELSTQFSSSALLVEICQKVEADCYLSGKGSHGYLEEEYFHKNKIGLEYQNYENTLPLKMNQLSILNYLVHTAKEDWGKF